MTYYCGIIPGAIKSRICIIDGKGDVTHRETLKNDFSRLSSQLLQFMPDLRCAVAANFNWYWLIDGLQDHAIPAYLAPYTAFINASRRRGHRSAIDHARELAGLLRIDSLPCSYIYPREDRPVRDLLRYRHQTVRRQTNLIRSLRSLLLRHGHINHAFSTVQGMKYSRLSEYFSDPSLLIHGLYHLEQIGACSRQVENLDELIIRQARRKPELPLLETIPGFNSARAVTVLYEVGQIRRFESQQQFTSYARLSPRENKRRKNNARSHGNATGNHYLKRAFVNAARAAVADSEIINKFYHKHVNCRKGEFRRRIAADIVARKLAVAAFVILKNREPYQERKMFRE